MRSTLKRNVRRRILEQLESKCLLAVGDVFFSIADQHIFVDPTGGNVSATVDLVFNVEGLSSVKADAWVADLVIEPLPGATGTVNFATLPTIYGDTNLTAASNSAYNDFNLDAGGNSVGFNIDDRLVALNWVQLPSTNPPTVDASGNLTIPDGAGLVSIPITMSANATGEFAINIVAGHVTRATNPLDRLEFEFLPRGTDMNGTVIADTTPPTVSAVKVSGSDWTPSMLANVDPTDGVGYTIPQGSSQDDTLPWSNIDRIHVKFSEDVGSVTSADFQLFGVGKTYGGSGGTLNVSYDPSNFTATIRLSQPIPADKLRLLVKDTITDTVGRFLDGDWTNNSTTGNSGNGTAGETFNFLFNVLPGDTTQSNGVSVNDVNGLRNGIGAKAGDVLYDQFSDLNGSGVLAVNDIGGIRINLGSGLPGGSPLSSSALLAISADDIDAVIEGFDRADKLMKNHLFDENDDVRSAFVA